MSSLLDIRIEAITTQDLYDKVVEEGGKDGGSHPLFPTHVVYKNGDIAGAFSIGAPVVFWWMHTQRIRHRDSLAIFQAADTLMNQNGYGSYVLPCEPESPYYKLLTNKLMKFSGTEGGDWSLFLNHTTGD